MSLPVLCSLGHEVYLFVINSIQLFSALQALAGFLAVKKFLSKRDTKSLLSLLLANCRKICKVIVSRQHYANLVTSLTKLAIHAFMNT